MLLFIDWVPFKRNDTFISGNKSQILCSRDIFRSSGHFVTFVLDEFETFVTFTDGSSEIKKMPTGFCDIVGSWWQICLSPTSQFTMNNWWSSLSHYLYQDFFVAVFPLRLPSSPILHKEFSRVLCFRFTQEKSSDNDVIMNFWWRHHIWSSYESPPAFPTWTVSWLIPPFNQLTPWCNYFVSIILTAKYHLPRLTTIWLTTS